VPPASSLEGIVVTLEDAKDMARSIANDVVAAAFRRAEYEALKVLAWRFPHGTHIAAMSMSALEHHAIYVNSEEVIHRCEKDGVIVSVAWISFLMKFPRWRILAWPSSAAHGDGVVEVARRRVGEQQAYSEILNNSEHFVQECYTGTAFSGNVSAGATATLSCAATSAATGAAVATPFAFSTTTVYMLGIIPWGTATVFSGGVVAAGALVGAAVGAAFIAPTYWSWRQSAREASFGRLPFCILNQSSRHLHVSTYHLNDTYRWVAVVGLAGQSSAVVHPQNIQELDPSQDADEFQVEIAFGEPPSQSWVGSAIGTVASVAKGAGSFATSLVQSVPYLSGDAKDSINLRVVVRRGGVYRVSERAVPAETAPSINSGSSGDGTAKSLDFKRVPRDVLPAYSPF